MEKMSGKILLIASILIVLGSMLVAQTIRKRTPSLSTDDIGSASHGTPTSNRGKSNGGGSVAWYRDLDQAINIAKSEKKLVVADVYTDWCGWCKKMDRDIYSDASIVDLSNREVFVKVDAEDRGQGQSFAQRMRVKGYPTTIILDGEGKVLNVARGYIDSPRAFARFVEEARARAD